MTKNHTPTPWHLEVGGNNEYEQRYYIECRKGVMPDYPGCTTIVDPELGITREEDAEFIVRACNAHDDLVAALQRCMKTLGGIGDSVREQANEALKKANAKEVNL